MTNFTDIAGNVHEENIKWAAANGITKGTNPPANDLYEPDEPVTRGQIASMLKRFHDSFIADGDPEPDPDPDPDPDPPPVVVEPIPAGAVYVDNSAQLASAVAANPSGTIFALRNVGPYTGQLPLKGGNQYWGDPSAPSTTWNGPGWNTVGGHWSKPTVSGVVLRHMRVTNYGPDTDTENGSVLNAQNGANSWHLIDMEIDHTAGSLVRWNPGWTVDDCHFHHAGRYAMGGGGRGAAKTLNNTEWGYTGVTHDGIIASTSSNRSGSKFALTSNITLNNLHSHHSRNGIWFDIANENITITNPLVEDCDKAGIFIEVSYGPCLITNPVVNRTGLDPTSQESGNPDLAVPAAIQISLTPDVTVTNPKVTDCFNGLIALQWAHAQLDNAAHDKSRMGIENVLFEGVAGESFVTNVTHYSAGVRGSYQPGTRPTRNIHWNNITFDANAEFRSQLHYP